MRTFYTKNIDMFVHIEVFISYILQFF